MSTSMRAMGLKGASETGSRLAATSATNGVLSEKEKSVHIVRKPATAVVGLRVVREATTGKQLTGGAIAGGEARRATSHRGLHLVPRIWAVADGPAMAMDANAKAAPEVWQDDEPKPEVAFYRKYTEGLLRRYLRMSTEAGRVPSFMGRELFRGNVTSYKVRSFEDVVIFCYDVEKCMKVLNTQEFELVKRIALQSYTNAEAATMLGLSLRWCKVLYGRAIDKLTQELMRLKLMNPMESCQ